MADFDPSKVRVAQTGRLFYQPFNATPTMPTLWTPETPYANPWSSLGIFNEDGVEHAFSDDITEITSWQRGVVRTVVTGRELTLSLSALETSVPVLEMFYGSEFVGVGGATPTSGKLDIPHAANRPALTLAFEWADPSTSSIWRLLVPRAQVGEVENPTMNAQGALEWGMTLRALGSDVAYLAQWSTNDPGVLAALTA